MQILFHELLLCFFEPVHQGLFRILGETRLIRDDVVQVVTEELGAPVTPVPIEYGEERSLFYPRG